MPLSWNQLDKSVHCVFYVAETSFEWYYSDVQSLQSSIFLHCFIFNARSAINFLIFSMLITPSLVFMDSYDFFVVTIFKF